MKQVITRLNVIETIWEDYAEDRGFPREAFINGDGVWAELEDPAEEHSGYRKFRPATENELAFEKAMDVITEGYMVSRYNQVVEF